MANKNPVRIAKYRVKEVSKPYTFTVFRSAAGFEVLHPVEKWRCHPGVRGLDDVRREIAHRLGVTYELVERI